MEAIQAATRNPAVFHGLERSVGTIEKGKIADIVVLSANPLEDISNTRKVNAVIFEGRMSDRAGIEPDAFVVGGECRQMTNRGPMNKTKKAFAVQRVRRKCPTNFSLSLTRHARNRCVLRAA